MIIHHITLENLARLCPDQVADFRSVLERYGLDLDNAIQALANDDDGELESESYEVADQAWAVLQTAFRSLNLAFEESTRKGCYYLTLVPVFNSDEDEGKGALIRVRHSTILNPAAVYIKHLLQQDDLTIYQSKEEWEKEKAVTGL